MQSSSRAHEDRIEERKKRSGETGRRGGEEKCGKVLSLGKRIKEL